MPTSTTKVETTTTTASALKRMKEHFVAPPPTTTTITVLRKQAVSFSLQELSSVGLREKNALWPTWILVKWLIKKNISKQWWYLVAFSLCWFLVKISKNYLFSPAFRHLSLITFSSVYFGKLSSKALHSSTLTSASFVLHPSRSFSSRFSF